MSATAISFAGFLLFFVIIGALAVRSKKNTTEDYLVAGRNVPAWLTALSAVSTNHSGFMFIGLVGFTYQFGVQSVWLMLGWMLGDAITWLFVPKKVRRLSEQHQLISIPSLLGVGLNKRNSLIITRFAGVLTFIFLAGYAAAQLKAASTALHVVFDWSLQFGIVLGAAIVLIYSFAGGIRASIWTDAAQAIVMVIAMSILLYSCVEEYGFIPSLFSSLEKQDPALIQWIPKNLAFGFGVYLLGFIVGGAGVIGQPHVLIRYMSIDSEHSIKKAGVIYFSWYALFSTAAVLVGLYSRVAMPELLSNQPALSAGTSAELALPKLAAEQLSFLSIGLILAGVFAATISTADSQILSCSAAITQDIFKSKKTSYLHSKLATLAVTALSLFVALFAGETVFSLVLLSWSILAVSLGAILFFKLWSIPIGAKTSITMMIFGIVTLFLWKSSKYSSDVFALLPALIVVWAISGLRPDLRKKKPNPAPKTNPAPQD